MAVEQHGLHLGEEVEVAVEVSPAGLHHADFFVGEVMHCLFEEVLGDDEVGIEDGDQFARGRGDAGLESTSFVALTIVAMAILHIEATLYVTGDEGRSVSGGLVGRVVENLDLEKAVRVTDFAGALEQAFHHIKLIEEG